MTIDTTDRLAALGDALEAAARTSIEREAQPLVVSSHRRGRAWLRGRRLALVAALAVLVPGAAVAATVVLSPSDVAASLPAGTLSLAGTEPTCTVVQDGVEYHCTLAKAPSDAGSPADWNGTVEPTVDANQKVNGGCRALSSDGTDWECYLGQAAVAQKIIGASFLGQTVSGPGEG